MISIRVPLLLFTVLLPVMLGCSPPLTIATIETQDVASKEMLEPMVSITLSEFQWQNRLLLLFAPGQDDAAYQDQLEQFSAEQAGFVERDLLVFELLADGNSRWDGQAIALSDVNTLRAQFDIGPEDFAVVLVGKDGTEKRRDTQPMDPQIIFLEIDAMPMRQREMRQSS